MKKIMLGVLLAVAAATAAQAATEQAIEASAVVNGTIVLAKDGTVQTAVIDDAAKYGQPIADLVQNAALKWRFKPVLQDGQPVVAKASMHARVVLTRKPDGNYSARIKGVTFGDYDPNDTSTVQYAKGIVRLAPKYPPQAIHDKVQGTVYLALHVDRSGHVIDAVAEQVNLGINGSEEMLKHYREIFATASLRAARQWVFTPPTTGREAKDDSWNVRVPITYNLYARDPKSEPVWQTYVPGPFTPPSWVDMPDANAADAIADDGLQTDGAGPTLLPASPNHS
jgi:hypothetical protein